MSEQEATLDEFAETDSGSGDLDTDELEQEQFGPFTLSTPGEWTAKRMGDIKQLITRGKQPTYADDGVPVINQECIYWDGWRFENLRYLDEDVAEGWKEKYFPHKGDVILNSTGQGTLGRAQVYPDDKRRAIDSHVTLLRTEEEVSPYFHRYFLESYLGQALLYSICVNGSTGQIELSKTRLDLLPVPIPPLEEQRKIASVLYTVDQAIQKTDSIRKQLLRVRKGVFQSVFTQGIGDTETKSVRLLSIDTEAPEHWEVVSVENVSTLVTDGAHLTPEKSESGYYLLGARNVQNGYVDLDDPDYVSEKEYRSLIEKCNPQPDDILMSCRGVGLGRVAVVPDGLECALLCSAALIKLEDSVHPEYVEKVLRHIDVQKQIKALQTQSAQPNLFQKEIASLEFPLPPIEEQKEIARLLSGYDEQIKFEEEYKNQLERLKQGLMQDLLSGEVRTHDKDIEVVDDVLQYG